MADDNEQGRTKLASAMGRILSKPLGKGASAEKPILAQHKGIEKELDEKKLEAKAKKALAGEKKAKFEVGRIKPEAPSDDFEKRLRKVATRGVVKLFNAISAAQKTADAVKANGVQKNAKLAPKLSKGSFLELVKSTTSAKEESSTPVVNSSKKAEKAPSSKPKETASASSDQVPWIKDDYYLQAGAESKSHWDLDSD
ncbi:hypothetical protein HDV05_003567 [Chytridiales sp. JEL 0842]|nr:hypothetical protein HDV05_003567 [Chytridiales sp. JEL 0842]